MSKNSHLSAAIANTYFRILLESVAEKGGSVEYVIETAQLPDLAADPSLTLRDWSRAILSAVDACADSGLGYEFGLRANITAHGMMSFALMTCSTLQQAWELFSHFATTRTVSLGANLTLEKDIAAVTLHGTVPISGPTADDTEKLQRFLYEAVLVNAAALSRVITGDALPKLSLHFQWPEPNYYRDYAALLPPVHFNSLYNQICCPTAKMSQPILTADSSSYQDALRLCEKEYEEKKGAISRLIGQINALLKLDPYQGYPSQEEICAHLNLSSTTLKRHLREQGTTFSKLLNQARHNDALEMLAKTSKSIDDISDCLGYSNPSNFIRAFRKQHGTSPNRFRTLKRTKK